MLPAWLSWRTRRPRNRPPAMASTGKFMMAAAAAGWYQWRLLRQTLSRGETACATQQRQRQHRCGGDGSGAELSCCGCGQILGFVVQQRCRVEAGIAAERDRSWSCAEQLAGNGERQECGGIGFACVDTMISPMAKPPSLLLLRPPTNTLTALAPHKPLCPPHAAFALGAHPAPLAPPVALPQGGPKVHTCPPPQHAAVAAAAAGGAHTIGASTPEHTTSPPGNNERR